jgi:hypothetical protein
MSAPTNKTDAAILAAFGRWSVASALYGAAPVSICPKSAETPEEAAQTAIIDAAEAEVLAAVATTPLGVEIQLWMALCHIETDREAGNAIEIMDIDWFLLDEGRWDWNVRLILSAIRSLRAMREQGK